MLPSDSGPAAADAASITEAVQRRIGHDLHDGLGQVVAGAAFMARGLLGKAPAPLQADLARLVETLNSALECVQTVSRGLVPTCLEQLDAREALRVAAAAIQAITPFEVTLRITPASLPLASSTKLQIALIAQEALRNAVRHGRARRVEVALDVSDGHATLGIRDDGTGLKPDSVRPGFGLASMHYRAHLLGGTLELTNVEGGGGYVRCVWPLEPATSHEPAATATP